MYLFKRLYLIFYVTGECLYPKMTICNAIFLLKGFSFWRESWLYRVFTSFCVLSICFLTANEVYNFMYVAFTFSDKIQKGTVTIHHIFMVYRALVLVSSGSSISKLVYIGIWFEIFNQIFSDWVSRQIFETYRFDWRWQILFTLRRSSTHPGFWQKIPRSGSNNYFGCSYFSVGAISCCAAGGRNRQQLSVWIGFLCEIISQFKYVSVDLCAEWSVWVSNRAANDYWRPFYRHVDIEFVKTIRNT